jgi:hypothetical protein
MITISFTVAWRYNCCTDGKTIPRNYGYPFVNTIGIWKLYNFYWQEVNYISIYLSVSFLAILLTPKLFCKQWLLCDIMHKLNEISWIHQVLTNDKLTYQTAIITAINFISIILSILISLTTEVETSL